MNTVYIINQNVLLNHWVTYGAIE